eukprot:NODE_7493_length_762_cov_127.974961_g7249_i0.p1 GENE.NODE_7493_length_762_cov_127.974961_g7249_i0~~NODE_7493_length_762_cov_127.974961_g7249_i0.p1  ORF type:complete len:212 (+),score=36.64 NODE_7493_length_762_cov_127.974961_g7249_i0:61-636(+)
MQRCCYRPARSSLTAGRLTSHRRFLTTAADAPTGDLPIWIKGTVEYGFQRGSRELGFPTANLDDTTVRQVPPNVEGVFYGWARVEQGEVLPMVMSLGYNLQYKQDTKTLEVHILEALEDFYGAKCSVVVTGYIRQMRTFDDIPSMVKALRDDCDVARKHLELPEHRKYCSSALFEQMDKQGKSVVLHCNTL